MTPNRLGLMALTLCLTLTGCSSAINASRESPIEDDRGTRTLGSKIDDSLIETKVAVNIAKASPDLDKNSHIVVSSFNGVVLIAGQTPRADLKSLAEQTAGQVQKVKKVHNELQVLQRQMCIRDSPDAGRRQHPRLADQGHHRERHRLHARPDDPGGSGACHQPGARRVGRTEDRETVRIHRLRSPKPQAASRSNGDTHHFRLPLAP